MNCVYGFKPTACRILYGGQGGAGRPGMFGILPAAGPLAHSVRDLTLLTKVVLNNDPWDLDETVIAAPYRNVEPLSSPLRLGLITEDPETIVSNHYASIGDCPQETGSSTPFCDTVGLSSS